VHRHPGTRLQWPGAASTAWTSVDPQLQEAGKRIPGGLRMSITELKLKSRLFLATAAAGLFVITGAAYAQEASESTQPAAQQNAQAPAQSADDSSYGGMAAGKSMAAGGYRQSGCSTAPNCDIFFGK